MASLPSMPTLPACTRGLSAADLSVYRDGAPVGDDAAALDAHIATCPVCRAQMEQFDRLAGILRTERAPVPDERLWQAMRRAAERGSPRRRGVRGSLISGIHIASSAGKRPLWSGLGTLAAVLLLVFGFVQLFALHGASTRVTHTPTPTPTPAPTLTPLPMPTATPALLLPPQPLAWHAETMPAAPAVFDSGQFAPAGDGQTAYACGIAINAANSNLLIWTTSDQGRSWTPAQVVPPVPNPNGCELVVDKTDPSVAALCWIPRGAGAGDFCTGWMTTVDGGTTWQTLPTQPFAAYDQLDSRGGVMYAVRETVDSNNTVSYHLSESRDRLHTWTNRDVGLSGAVAGFWLQPEGRAILAVTTTASDQGTQLTSQLWLSSDDGATWSAISRPTALPAFYARLPTGPSGNGIVAASGENGAFVICYATFGQGTYSLPNPNTLTCSTDSGASWTLRSALNRELAPGVLAPTSVVGITSDGSVLAEVPAAQVTATVPQPGYTLYRLAPGASIWQPLGALPQAAVTYCRSPGAGLVWATSGFAGNLDPQHRIFTASYTP